MPYNSLLCCHIYMAGYCQIFAILFSYSNTFVYKTMLCKLLFKWFLHQLQYKFIWLTFKFQCHFLKKVYEIHLCCNYSLIFCFVHEILDRNEISCMKKINNFFLMFFISFCSAALFSSYTAPLQASQVSIELMEKSNRLVELEDILSTRDKEIKELHSKLHEVVCMLPVQHSCSMNNA